MIHLAIDHNDEGSAYTTSEHLTLSPGRKYINARLCKKRSLKAAQEILKQSTRISYSVKIKTFNGTNEGRRMYDDSVMALINGGVCMVFIHYHWLMAEYLCL